jgi:pimeloyl-ACP methyl ester carboxylesterase
MSKLLIPFILLFFSGTLTAQNENQPTMNDWTYPYQVKHLALNDSINIAYIDEGSGDSTLLFVHGLGSNLQAWKNNIDTLRHQYRCIAIDLPGYGKSSKESYPFSMQFFGKAIQDFTKNMGLEKPTLIGHSMGGQASIHAALAEPDLFSNLILVAPAGFEQFSEAEKIWFKNVYTPELIKMTPVEQIKKNFEINFYQMPDDALFMIEDRLKMRETTEYDYYCAMIPQCVYGMLTEPVFDRLPELSTRTLVVFGANDALIPNKFMHPELTTEGVANAGKNQIPEAQLVLLDEAGHFVQWEQAAAFNKLLTQFIQAKK